ncbi:MAG: anti-sigma factor [Dehalococcoidia bacterium]
MPGEHITQGQADEYAIGALEPHLERAVALHLAECHDCRDMVRDSERLAATLAMAAPSRRASRRLRRQVWMGAGLARPTLIQRAARFVPAAAAVAAMLVAAAAFTGMVSVRSEVNGLRTENVNLQSEIKDVQSQKVEIAALTERLAEAEASSFKQEQATRSDRELMLAMMSPESDTANLQSTPGHDSAIGRLIWDEANDRVWFVTNRLPQRPAGQTYHVWVNADGKWISLGTFNTDATGFARFETVLPEGIGTYVQALVTIESIAAEERGGDAVFVATLWSLRN